MNGSVQRSTGSQEHASSSILPGLIKSVICEEPSNATALTVWVNSHSHKLELVRVSLEKGAGSNNCFSFNGREDMAASLDYSSRFSAKFIVRFFKLKILL